ncbi:MAG: ATP-binding protein, partial [Cyanobacteria bacterium J06649_11]
MIPRTSTNLRNRVNKLYLPRTKALYPLFELISNSIHAIQEVKENSTNGQVGRINIDLLRIVSVEALEQVESLDAYPVDSFVVYDNGIGLNDSNFTSFMEFDSEKKAEIGGKGVGRLVCLKAFRELHVESVYRNYEKELKIRRFKY